MQKFQRVNHEFPPVFDKRSRVLMLGTMPSPKSRENGFYYGHPRNRFWPVLAQVCQSPCPQTREEKISFALEHKIAVWDVLQAVTSAGRMTEAYKIPFPMI